MRKNILLIISFISTSLAYGQVGIKTTNPTKTLDINGELRIRDLPQGQPSDNILTTDSTGNIKKVSIKDLYIHSSFGFNCSLLGYNPKPANLRPQPPCPVPGGGTATELGFKKWEENNHIYCAYKISQPITWHNAFLFAKDMGGYLVTMTNNKEREWVNENIVSSEKGFNLANNIWIGFSTIKRPGNPDVLQWITGEEFKIDWSTTPSSAEHWFNAGEPSNSCAKGATHILARGMDVKRRWNVINGNITSNSGFYMDQIIIEFNE